MSVIIRYTIRDSEEYQCVISPEMFDPNSSTRLLLAARGILFNSDEEVINWVKAKDIPFNAVILS